MSLDDFSLHDPRVVLVRAEHLSPRGLTAAGAAFLADRAGWSGERAGLLDAGFRLYWTRAEALSRRAPELAPPRLRNLAILVDAEGVRPFVALLNQSTWSMVAADFDPERSHPELIAWLFVHADRIAQVGEVTLASVHLAPYWFERSDRERQTFAEAARGSTRPDVAVHRAVADALPWLRELRHARMRPPRRPAGHRAVPGTGLLVPDALAAEPERLVETTRAAATGALEAYHARWQGDASEPRRRLLAWLAGTAPSLLVTIGDGRVVWQPDRAADVAALRSALEPAGPAAVRDIHADLEVVDEHTERFLGRLVDRDALAASDAPLAQSGYVFMHRERRLLAYNLHEPAVERLLGPAVPYARAMLGARALHEWAHLAVDGGCVPRVASDAEWDAAVAALADELDAAIARAPREVRERTRAGLDGLAGTGTPGQRLCELVLARLPDYRSNLLAARLWSEVERETYVLQNVRPLRAEVPPERLWSMLARYLYELQYLRFSSMPEPRRYFVRATWFDRDFLQSRVLDAARFERLAECTAALCQAHAVAEDRFRDP